MDPFPWLPLAAGAGAFVALALAISGSWLYLAALACAGLLAAGMWWAIPGPVRWASAADTVIEHPSEVVARAHEVSGTTTVHMERGVWVGDDGAPW
ncbi:hypothetical protein [Kineosporia succinea]|uniref:Competence protein ComEC n=1 Tax=Kineosporia succinea TaxID=84632 RepID=A0ABT9P9X7_9ACTN|nr:hypothetical protein [Kineosporia succinea]MDP9829351.1 hypothetical protein [Kineosporia succinea]